MVDLRIFGGRRKCDLNTLDKIFKELKDILFKLTYDKISLKNITYFV